jgi:biopolymer transport protein ExbB
MKQYKTVQTTFWRAASLKEGAAKLEKDGAWRQLADDAVKAQEDHGKMTDALESHDYMHGTLQRSEDSINSVLAGGLPFLATVGATAPFVGLLGTVIGIYRALINIGIEGSASIDKVAGPVGEALIMTAIGLLVAVPAVLAFNWLQSRNRRINELLSGFSTDILAYINSNGAVKPTPVAAAPAKPAAKPANAPATKA